MRAKVRFMAKNAKPKLPVTVQEAKRRLRLYNEKVDEIRSLSFRKKVFIENHGITLNFAAGQPLTFEKRGADFEAISAVVTILRLFYQPGPQDHISLWQVAELYETLPVPKEDREAIKKSVASVDNFLDGPLTPLGLNIEGKPMTNRTFFDLMMYGHYVHVNADKRKMFEKYIKDTLPYHETSFEAIVARLVNVIWSFPETNKRAIQVLEGMADSEELQPPTSTTGTVP